MNQLATVFLLLVVYQLKHFVADFPLQGKYMLQKFNKDWSFFWPLAAHAGVHAYSTLLIANVYMFLTHSWGYGLLPMKLAIMDFVIHFSMDRIKAGPKYLGRYKDMYAHQFWWSLGLDQMVHHLTHYWIIWQLVTS